MLSATRTFEEVAALIGAQDVSSATIVTHGFQFGNDDGDSLYSLATAIGSRVNDANQDAPVWFLDYDIDGEGATGGFDDSAVAGLDALPDLSSSGIIGDVVLLFDWATESNELSAGWGEAAGDALFSMLVGLGIVNPALGASNTTDLHFIGHSFGTAVTSEAIERLAVYDVPVEHVTYLDPHDFNEGIAFDARQELSTLGRPSEADLQDPDAYGASVWKNVEFADVYYQTESVPEGRPIPGAYNVNINASVDGLQAHSDVWQQFYLNTVTSPDSETGYAYSSVVQQTATTSVDRPEPRFYDATQSHEHTSLRLVDRNRDSEEADYEPASDLAELGLSERDVTMARWEPAQDPLAVTNGDFVYGGDENDAVPLVGSNLIPGWSHHGGGGGGTAADDGSSYLLRLDSEHSSRTHNLLYVPELAGSLQFSLNRTQPSGDELLVVRLGDTILTQVPLDGGQAANEPVSVDVPLSLRNRVHTLSFTLESSDGQIEATVQIDDVRFQAEVFAETSTDGVVKVDLKGNADISGFRITGYSALPFDFSTSTTLAARTNSRRGDVTLRETAESEDVAGTLVFSNRVDGEENTFDKTGQFYFAPGTADGLPGDALTGDGDRGFQGYVRIQYEVDVDGSTEQRSALIKVLPGQSDEQIHDMPDVVNVMRVQQRLNYLGYTDDAGDRLAVDGILGPLTFEALTRFNGENSSSGVASPQIIPELLNPSSGDSPLESVRSDALNNGLGQLRELFSELATFETFGGMLPLVGKTTAAGDGDGPEQRITIGRALDLDARLDDVFTTLQLHVLTGAGSLSGLTIEDISADNGPPEFRVSYSTGYVSTNRPLILSSSDDSSAATQNLRSTGLRIDIESVAVGADGGGAFVVAGTWSIFFRPIPSSR